MNAIEILLDSARGIYIPKDFVEKFDLEKWNISLSEEDMKSMQDPCNDWYWDIWEEILDNARRTTPNGDVYTLHQDGDLFAICFEKMTDEQKESLGFED